MAMVGSYVASHKPAVATQSGPKDQVNSIAYYITLNSNFKTWRVHKNLKNVEDKARSQSQYFGYF
jgi:hypothetical protein